MRGRGQVRQQQFRTKALALMYDLQTIIAGPEDLELSFEFEVAAKRKQCDFESSAATTRILLSLGFIAYFAKLRPASLHSLHFSRSA
jgi:hypothetical protein